MLHAQLVRRVSSLSVIKFQLKYGTKEYRGEYSDSIMPESSRIHDLIDGISGFHLVFDAKAFDDVVRDIFRFGSDNSDTYWGFVMEERFAQDPRVLLIDRASREFEEIGWLKYTDGWFECWDAQQIALGDRANSGSDSAVVDIGLAGALIELAIWDDNTMVFKVKLERRFSLEEVQNIWFSREQVPCADRNPFITVGTMIEDADLEQVGRDLLWRWMNPPAPNPDGQEVEEEPVERIHIRGNIYITKRKKKAGKINCMLLGNPVFVSGVIRPIFDHSRRYYAHMGT